MKPKYVIINDTDAPQPNMVCQWVPEVGYCYMDRSKATFDGMKGRGATPVEAFGVLWAEDSDGMTRFYPSEKPPAATYQDGKPRRWHGITRSFEWKRLTAKVAAA